MKNLKITLFLCLVAGLCACNVQQRQIRKLDQLAVQQPDEFKRLSNWLNPCFSGTAKSDTVISIGKADTAVNFTILTDSLIKLLPGTLKMDLGTNYLVYHGSALFPADTVLSPAFIKTITIHAAPKIITIHDTVPDTRAVAAAQSQFNQEHDARLKAETTSDQKSRQAAIRLWWIIGLASIIGLYFIYRFCSWYGSLDMIKNRL